jgi:hypothetical protein
MSSSLIRDLPQGANRTRLDGDTQSINQGAGLNRITIKGQFIINSVDSDLLTNATQGLATLC